MHDILCIYKQIHCICIPRMFVCMILYVYINKYIVYVYKSESKVKIRKLTMNEEVQGTENTNSSQM